MFLHWVPHGSLTDSHIVLLQNECDSAVLRVLQRLHHELKDAVQRQLEALPVDTGVGDDLYVDDEIVRNLQEQLQLANQVSDMFFKWQLE